jgi:RHS repeat-associated protein
MNLLQRTLLYSCSLVLAAAASATRAAAQATYTESGRADFPSMTAPLDFQTDLYTGRFGYSVPIEMPPARLDFKPSVSLAYSSAGSNGVCGFGWTLAAGGAIQRDVRKGVPVLWAGQQPLQQYDDDKGFTVGFNGLSGELIEDQPGVYRARGDSHWTKFEFFGNTWVATERSGTKHYFGETTASRAKNPLWPEAATSTFQWALSRSTDTNGNEIHYEYTTNGNQLYLSAISYNGNLNPPGLASTARVEFLYGSRLRLDPAGLAAGKVESRTSFLTGYRVETNQRLNQIKTHVLTNLVRTYDLGYETSASTLRSRLASVTETDNGAALPPLTFAYQDDQRAFQHTTWGPLRSEADNGEKYWNSVRNRTHTIATIVEFRDYDGDALPDRIMRKLVAPYDKFVVQLNTGTGFEDALHFDSISERQPVPFNPVSVQDFNSPHYVENQLTHNLLIDLSGDGLPDRLWMNLNGSLASGDWEFQINSGSDFLAKQSVTGVVGQNASPNWLAPLSDTSDAIKIVTLLDIDGSGRPARVSRQAAPDPDGKYSHFVVQLQTAPGQFSAPRNWNGVATPGQLTHPDFNSPEGISADTDLSIAMRDINGDGLIDHALREPVPSLYGDPGKYDYFVVQFNNGSGFEPAEPWGPVTNQGYTGSDLGWNSPTGVDSSNVTFSDLADINGDGLLDHVMRKLSAPYDRLVVQINNGSGFELEDATHYPIETGSMASAASWSSVRASDSGNDQYVDLIDIDANGLLDRVRRKEASPFNPYLEVELAVGPFPDLLNKVTSSIGGEVRVNYSSAASCDNHNGPGGTLPFPLQIVASVTTDDGIGTQGTTSYVFRNGFYSPADREFRGFRCSRSVSPSGLNTVSYYYQGGGIDDPSQGEYLDTRAKAGIPFLVQQTNASAFVYQETFNRVQLQSFPSGWEYPYVDLSLTRTREPASSLVRVTASASVFEHAVAGKLVERTDYGRVLSTNPATFQFTDSATSGDTIHSEFLYADFTLGNPEIQDRLERVTREDASGQKIDETEFDYDVSNGNVLSKGCWLDTTNSFLTEHYTYTDRGSLETYTDRMGVQTTTQYEQGTDTFPSQTTTLDQVTEVEYDVRTGNQMSVMDRAGLLTEYVYDPNYRLSETRVATTKNASTADLWVNHYDYNLQTPQFGDPRAYVLRKQNDLSGNGIWTVEYLDGFGRSVQRKAEAEAGAVSGYRALQTRYDGEGRVIFESVPFWSAFAYVAPSQSIQGTSTAYDLLGRVVLVTPPTPTSAPEVTDSPAGQSVTSYGLADSPWGKIETDPRGIGKSTRFDSRGHVTELIELRGAEPDLVTNYEYDLLGNVTLIQHPHLVGTSTGIQTVQDFDSLGRRTVLTDPDVGTRTFTFDAMNRPLVALDALGYRSEFHYDGHGRLLDKKVFAPNNGPQVRIESYVYDTNLGDSTYSVEKGQLFMVTDEEGWVKNSYTFSGRLLVSSRRVNVENKTYTTTYDYDGVGRVQAMHYPTNTLEIQLTYDGAGHLDHIEDFGGGNDYYDLGTVDEFDRPTSIAFGNGTVSTSTFYPVSGRMKLVQVNGPGGLLQSLTYKYLSTGHVASIADGVPGHSGTSSSALSGIQYDGLYRVTQLQRPGAAAATFTYDDLGNLLTNSESGATLNYTGTRPHAVTSALGQTFGYDANGSMTSAGVGGATLLSYDEEGQLAQYGTGTPATTFGYTYDGQRLWRNNAGAGRTTWIGSHFEQRGSGKAAVKYCYVLVNGKRVASVSYGSVQQIPPPASAILYFHADSLGGTNLVTDGNGALQNHFEYATYGKTQYQLSSAAPSNLFAGQVLDGSTSLYWMGSRYYDPLLGRFVQPDATVPDVETPQSLNRYTYALNDPLQYVDPSGHFPFLAILASALISGAEGSMDGGGSRGFWKGFAVGAISGAAGGMGGPAGQVARMAAGGIGAAIMGGNPALGMMGAMIAPGFTSVGAGTEMAKGSFSLQSLGRQLQLAGTSRLFGLAAGKLGFDPMFLQVGLFVVSGAGGSRFRESGTMLDGKGLDSIANHLHNPSDPGILGVFNRGLIGVLFDAVDVVLAYQGISTASSVAFENWAVKNHAIGTTAWGHSLGSIDITNLAFAGVVTNPDLIALPIGVIAPAGATVRIGQQDFVTGFVTNGCLNVLFGNNVVPVNTSGTFLKAFLPHAFGIPSTPHNLRSYPLN